MPLCPSDLQDFLNFFLTCFEKVQKNCISTSEAKERAAKVSKLFDNRQNLHEIVHEVFGMPESWMKIYRMGDKAPPGREFAIEQRWPFIGAILVVFHFDAFGFS